MATIKLLLAVMGDEPQLNISWLAKTLSIAYTNVLVEVYDRRLDPPKKAYNTGRRQYLSEVVLEEVVKLKKLSGVDAVLLVADIDAYSPGLNFVFGQAILGGGVAAVYTRRLRPEFYNMSPDPLLYRERLLKEALHELGHAFGLGHCLERACVMSFSNSVIEVDEKAAKYCRICGIKLAQRGVVLSEKFLLAY
ncbi:hypothetical protein Pyrde_1967 [Pyrodictium delaneyi]|uniref:Archaemetzincin n=1 Tax=Pyrodictium delaneyi TaxID=1273541 RepID=A0A0P0N6Q1_9CREN|nr:archaemetzincin family Zn-dependent metalloprotease [Pyrodictium delaneyi]ALL02010.1 hypothetical protein Pyrde_1967 [Pyrodictium delaneyi]OWJ54826.1 hypothetical protein Pdsh_03680 [Pyrodictium delaneyi]